LQALASNDHRITFYEPGAYDRQRHRDIPDLDWASVVVYSAEGEEGVARALDEARNADLIVKASGVGVFDRLLEARVPAIKRPVRSRRSGTSMLRPRSTASPPTPTTRSAR
jgi:spore maturation protein CgeB